jgi:hypothetical protein
MLVYSNFGMSHGSIVSIATGYRLNNREVRIQVPVGSRILTSPYLPDWLWGPPNLLSNGSFSLGVKQQGREADHSPPASAKLN